MADHDLPLHAGKRTEDAKTRRWFESTAALHGTRLA